MIIDWPAMGYFCLKRLKTCLFSFWNHKYKEHGNDKIYAAFDLYLQWGGYISSLEHCMKMKI